jgi:hypothetical protein
MALDFVLPIGPQTVNQGAGVTTTLTGTTQASVKLGAYRCQATAQGTNNVQGDIILSDFRIANQSVFTSSGAGTPASMLQAAVQAKDFVAGVSLAAGTSVQLSVIGGAVAYDVGAWITTDPMDPGTEPGFDLQDIALIFPLAAVVVPGAIGGTVIMQATCNRSCTLGKVFLSSTAPDVSVTSILVSGEEQLAQSTTVGIPIAAFGALATMEDGDFDLNKAISPGETVAITIQNATAVAANALGGIYCI